jgi:crotonobetainyl-CoA:carnitine CoA-transferase CaiB-like acyl-CoA transferase
MAHLKELEDALAPYFRRHSSADLLARFEAAGVPAGLVYDVLQMHADPRSRRATW